jgi:CheY-like chemotaxis protein
MSVHYLKNILLADDDEDDCLLFQDVLSDLPIKTNLTVAKNGQEVLQLLSASIEPPDIIFLDMNMPLLNGVECLKEIRRIPGLSTTPVIILSTSSHSVAVEDVFNHGADLYIRKPDTFKKLRTIVEALIFQRLSYPKKLEQFLISE